LSVSARGKLSLAKPVVSYMINLMGRKEIIETIRKVLREHGVPSAYLFGSFARKERTYHDVDIAIDPPAGKFSLLDLVGIEQELAEKTGKKVDVVILRSIKPRLKSNIEKDLTALL